MRVSEAARRLGITTKELLALIQERRIAFVMRDGIAHITSVALNEYQQTSA
jgi:excisionase family DNA binding protein